MSLYIVNILHMSWLISFEFTRIVYDIRVHQCTNFALLFGHVSPIYVDNFLKYVKIIQFSYIKDTDKKNTMSREKD